MARCWPLVAAFPLTLIGIDPFEDRSSFAMIVLRWLVNFFLRIAQQCAEPFVYFYEHWLLRDPDMPMPAWVEQRRKYFKRSIPAMLAGLGVLGIGILGAASSSGVQKRYRERLDGFAGGTQEIQIARLGQRIVSDSSIFGSEDRFELACRLSELDSEICTAQSDRLLDDLAPGDSQGYAPAHRLRALAQSRILSQRPVDPGELESLGWHVQQSLGIEDEALQRTRSDFYLATGKINLATSELSKLANVAPDYWFALAEVLLARGDLNSARNALGRAAGAFEKLVSLNPADIEARIRYATALGRLGEFDSAIEIMSNGWKLTPDERFREGLCEVYLMKFQKNRNLQGPIEPQWEYLQSALEWNPKNRLVYEALSQLCADVRVRAFAPMVRSKIDSLLDAPEFSSELMFAKSNLLLVDKQFGLAIEALGQIVQKDPKFHPAMNNLAWLLIDQATVLPEHLEQAQLHAKRAVELLPSSASYRDTLGMVFFKQRRWTEAIAEFEVALRNSQNSLPTLEKIAQAYQELGQLELSNQYRSRIEQLRSVGGSAKSK